MTANENDIRRKITDAIRHQFDAEVFLKHRELAAIQIEIEKAESIIHDLDLSIKNESYAAFLPNLPHYTRRTASAIGYGRSVSSNNNSAKSNTTKQNQSSVLFGRRSDGVYVKLACPACHRENFSNQLGFLNHCRISHSLEFGPYENVMIQCGTPVEETEVPEDHPVRNRPLPLPILPIKTKGRPIIKEYEEHISLELDQCNQAAQPGNEEGHSMKIDDATLAIEQHICIPSLENSAKTGSESPQIDSNLRSESEPTEAFVSAIEDKGSRFYIKRRVVIGNVSKFIPAEKRDTTLMNYTHKWMIYVAELDGDKSEPRFVTAVRYHLHPSYKPFDIVDVTEPPFRLTRLGWGEFPIRLQLRFVDTHRNKSVDVIHHLKLDYTLSGRQMFGSERAIDIELDRSTDFNDKSPIQPAPPSTAEMQEAKSSTRLIHEEQEHTLGPDGHPMAHLHFCRFCGAPEHLSTDCHRIPNGWRKRGYGLCDRSSLSDSKLLLGMLSSYNQDEIAEIDDDMYRSIVPKLERYRDLAKLITNSAVVKIEQDASRQMALDWIWNVTSEIRLRTMVGSEIFLDKHSILQLPRSMALESNISTAMQQRLAVGDLLLQATKSFLRHLLISGVAVCRQQNLSSKETGHMLVPYHIHEATRLVSEFDFLSCKFMQKTPAESAKPK